MVDLKERYDRIHSFMKRNARIVSAEHHINWINWMEEKYNSKCYSDEDKQKAQDNLKKAKELQTELAHKVFNEMIEGVINNTTQGIWFSYNKGFERLKDLPDKTRRYIMTLETGEKFLTERKYIQDKYRYNSHTLEKMRIIKKL